MVAQLLLHQTRLYADYPQWKLLNQIKVLPWLKETAPTVSDKVTNRNHRTRWLVLFLDSDLSR